MIWKRWVKEYLPQHNARTQWNKGSTNLNTGALVWLVDDNLERSHYRMARVIETYPGKGGVVRSVLIKTSDGTT